MKPANTAYQDNQPPAKDANRKFETRMFRTPPYAFLEVMEWIATDTHSRGPYGYSGFTELSSRSPARPSKATIQRAFERIGITFPQGAVFSYREDENSLVVTNTPEAHDAIAQFLWDLGKLPAHVAVELTLVQMPVGAVENLLQQEFESQNAVLVNDDTLPRIRQLAKASKIKILASLKGGVTSGEAAKQMQIARHAYVEKYKVKNGAACPVKTTRETGLIFDYKPYAAQDRKTISMTASFEYVVPSRPTKRVETQIPGIAQPVLIDQPGFQKRVSQASFYIESGRTMLFAIFNSLPPEDEPKEESSQKLYVFLTARIVNPYLGEIVQPPWPKQPH